jgi:hypothetical protein
MSGGPNYNSAGGMSCSRSLLGPILDLDPFAVGSNAAKLPVGRGHSRPRAADKLEDDYE